MKKITIDNRVITTNFGGYYPVAGRKEPSTMALKTKMTVKDDGAKYARYETDDEFFKRLVSYGYTRITFYESTTSVRGYHHTIAYVK